ncbi:hypothetical protein GMRT_10218 [Giardia muris]|uniref:Uncharacterized protein n=1 Tax=Giardia muris TaxID=5742 RepID=A0A4Z1TAE9_GIAMU|nr:hypothetical protein GMRT_10218 [Giardia muris]|eukprot:TNJ29489.1 hypothetical protein GMRT_10218 [Giardia muris]
MDTLLTVVTSSRLHALLRVREHGQRDAEMFARTACKPNDGPERELYILSLNSTITDQLREKLAGEKAAVILLTNIEAVDINTELLVRLDELLYRYPDMQLLCALTTELVPYPFLRLFQLFIDLRMYRTSEGGCYLLTATRIDEVSIHPTITAMANQLLFSLGTTNFSMRLEGVPDLKCLNPLPVSMTAISTILRCAQIIALHEHTQTRAKFIATVLPRHLKLAILLVLTHQVGTLPLTELTVEDRKRITEVGYMDKVWHLLNATLLESV